MAPTLDDTWTRVRWAYSILQRLRQDVETFHRLPPYSITDTQDGDVRIIEAHSPLPVPVEMSLLLGDLVHSLHAALDYAVCSMVEAVGAEVTKRHAFPIFDTQDDFDHWLPRRLAHVPRPRSS